MIARDLTWARCYWRSLDCLQMARFDTFGLSNFRWERAQRLLERSSESGLPKPAVISAAGGLLPWVTPLWSNAQTLAGAQKQRERAWYEHQAFALLLFSPLGRGFFKSKAAGLPVDFHYDCPSNHERYRRASALARHKGVSPAQIALSFLLHQSTRSFAVIGSRDLNRLRMAAAAADIQLSPQEYGWLDLIRATL